MGEMVRFPHLFPGMNHKLFYFLCNVNNFFIMVKEIYKLELLITDVNLTRLKKIYFETQ